jgi:lactate dehydrogenase-like 2-hydroxyacid dehydrogenase
LYNRFGFRRGTLENIMRKPKVFIARLIRDKGLELIREACEAEVWPDELPPSRAELLARVRGVDGLLTLLTDRVDEELLDAAGPQLKVVSNHAVGYDNVDIAAATVRRLPVGNTPDVLTDATADFAFALLLAAGRRITEAERYVRAGHWKTWGPSLLLGADFVGATLGIVGYGRIGKALTRRARGFEMRVLYCDPSEPPDPQSLATPVDFETLLREADFISLHTPLTPQTRGLINADALRKVKPTAVLVNTARGPVVDPEALYHALKDGRLFAAALDVTDPEPLPLDSPLLTLENCLIVPHIASASTRTRDQMSYLAAQNLVAGVRGEPLPHCVNPQVYG